MVNRFVEHIAGVFTSRGKQVILIKNPDGFLSREDVGEALNRNDITVVKNSRLKQRIVFELRKRDYSGKTLLFLCSDTSELPEDIRLAASEIDFHLSVYIYGYHLSTIINENLNVLDKLFQDKQLVPLSEKETKDYLKSLRQKEKPAVVIDTETLKKNLEVLIKKEIPDWGQVMKLLSEALVSTIGGEQFGQVLSIVNLVNERFQEDLKVHYKQLASSSPVKRPKVVSKILDHLDTTGRNKKTALIVVDGMSFWQYLLLNKQFPDILSVKNDITFSWIPSITQLSRQAIFRGGIPDRDYIQNPKNEEKLWINYWTGKGLRPFEIRYDYESINYAGLNRILKLAVVFKDLDDKMHSSTDLTDLKSLTEHWIERSGIIAAIQKLLDEGFTVYITSDHGNILAKGWRNLKGKEKLGTNKSGSRSQRHLEYSNYRLASEFLASNDELNDFVSLDEKVIYFTGDYSFSPKASLVTHGGSHILEVVIPFIKIDYEH